jgi:glycosyltransferase involved in cell wall biosynthesis
MALLKLLWITDLSETGYTNASRTLIQYLTENKECRERYEVYIYGINHAYDNAGISKFQDETLSWFPRDRILWSDNTKFLLNYIPPQSKFMTDGFYKQAVIDQRTGLYDLERIIVQVSPDIVLTINDNGVLINQLAVLNEIETKHPHIRPKKIAYMPIDCYDFPRNFFDGLTGYDMLITMTQLGRQEIEKTGYKRPVEVLNHSIDNRSFYPLSERAELRRKWFPSEFLDRYIILNSNKNQNRKRLDITIEIYKTLIDRNLPVALILKTSKLPSINNGGIDLDKEIEAMPLKYRRYLFIMERKLTLNELNELYNCIDVNINTSIGEGWGIVPCEVGLCGIPQLVPNSTSYPEIFDRESLVNCKDILRIVAMNEAKIETANINVLLKGIIRPVERPNITTVDVTYVGSLSPCPESHIFTILVSEEYSRQKLPEGKLLVLNNGLAIRRVVPNVVGLGEWLYNNRRQIQAFQIVGQNGENMREFRQAINDITKDLGRLSAVYKIVMMNPEDICRLVVRSDLPSTKDFADKIEALYKYPKLAERIGNKCRDNILKRFNIERIGEKLAIILRKLTDARLD